jgi:hypothetical protein
MEEKLSEHEQLIRHQTIDPPHSLGLLLPLP